MAKKNSKSELVKLKTELDGLKARLKRVEEFLLDFPSAEIYLKAWDLDYEDSLFDEAVKIVRQEKRASSSLLQRRLMTGYARTVRLIDMMEKKGIIGPGIGSQPRKILKP